MSETQYKPLVMEHCCACAKSEDVQNLSSQIIGVAGQIIADVGHGALREAADEVLIAAFKSEKVRLETAGLPRL